MAKRIAEHFRGNVVAYVALFFALGGSAYAVTALDRNSVKSKHIKNGQVKSADVKNNGLTGGDINESSLGTVPNAATAGSLDGQDSTAFQTRGAEAWHEVGAAGEPQFTNGTECVWSNQHVANNSAAFARDGDGFVHLKGVVRGAKVNDPCTINSGDPFNDEVIFTLPQGYRPAANEHHPTLTNFALGQIEVRPSGVVMAVEPATDASVQQWISLDGITFRCAPVGASGCP